MEWFFLISTLTNILLANAELTYQVFEDVVLNASGEMEMSREQELRNGTGHALVVADAGRGNGGAQYGGRGDRGGRGRNRRNDNRGGHQQQQQQQQQQHVYQQRRNYQQQSRREQQEQQHVVEQQR